MIDKGTSTQMHDMLYSQCNTTKGKYEKCMHYLKEKENEPGTMGCLPCNYKL